MTITESGMLTLINPVPRAEPFDHPDWVFEAAAENVRGRLISCNGNRMQRFEGVLDLVFDGEVVVLDYAERPPFNELHRKTISQDNDKLRGNAVMTKPFAALAWPLAAALLVFNGVAGAAQFLPYHPLTMVVPFAAGGPTDVLGRVIAGRMSEVLGQNVVVDNVVGAGGMIGSARVAYAAPDGYQFVLGTVGTHAQEQTLYKHPPYDATTDFTPVILIAVVPLVLETRKDLQVSNFRDFVAYAKRHQGGCSALPAPVRRRISVACC
jgi:hypothetical protein